MDAMKPAPFTYHRPGSLSEVFDLLDHHGGDARILAGGQSLVPALNMRLATPTAVIDINRIPGLDGIRLTTEGLHLGALARQDDVERSPLVREHAPLLAQALPNVGHVAIRTRGTIGGSVALGDPAAELPACLVALGATVRATSRRGARAIPAGEFFRGIYTTALAPDEVLTEVVVPRPGPDARAAFDELARRQGDFALVALAAACRLSDGVMLEPRLVFAGVAGTPVRATRAEAALAGRRPEAPVLEEAARAVAGDLDPPSDVQASGPLRRHLAAVLLRRVAARLGRGS